MTSVINIKSISQIIDKYELIIIDQWGVMHNGKFGYSYAIECINKLYNLDKKLIIISNSSKRKSNSVERLPELGFNNNYFSEVMTSGEMIWQELKIKKQNFSKKLGKNCFHLTYKENQNSTKYVEGLDYNFVDDVEKADFILACIASPKLSTLDYVPILEKAIKRKLPFICANPDFETIESTSEKKNICMGSVAELYKEFGGSIFSLGKPSIEIYYESTKKFKDIDKHKILAIGDSMYHDIKGAINFNVDSLLITSGIHSSLFKHKNPIWDKNNNEISNFNFKPTYLCSNFQF